MKPNVYIDSREHSGTRGSIAVDLIILDVGHDAPIAYITLPFSTDDLTPQIEWCKRELTKLTAEAECAEAAKLGRIEFEVADVKSGTLYTVNDVVAELLQAVSLRKSTSHVQSMKKAPPSLTGLNRTTSPSRPLVSIPLVRPDRQRCSSRWIGLD